MGADAETLLEASAVERRYPMGSVAVAALAGVDFAVRAGEMVGVVGRSGSGKSTLLQCLGGLDRPTAGEIRFRGRGLAGLSEDALADYRRTSVGFVFQSFHLLAHLTALENAMLPLLLAGRPEKARRARAVGLLEGFGLKARLDHRPTQLSGGEQQRVALARALVHDPPLLLADEPTGNLDSVSAREIFEYLRRLNRDDGRTVVVVTHEADLAREFCPRRIIMKDGRVDCEERAGGG